MNAVTAFTHRKDQLHAQLCQAQSLQDAILACTMALEQVACELAQDEQDEHARQRQQAVLAVARRVPAMLQAAGAKGEIVVDGEMPGEAAGDRFGRAMQTAGVLALTGLATYEYFCGRQGIALLQALGALAFVAGGLRMRPQREETAMQARGVVHVEATAAVQKLLELCEAVDVCVSDLAMLDTAGGRARLSGSADEAMLDLLVALMEAKQSGREALAMRSLSLAEEYLHMLGVEIVTYTEATAQMFDALPTMGEARTVRPALVKEGKVLRRGVAAVSAAGRSVGA